MTCGHVNPRKTALTCQLPAGHAGRHAHERKPDEWYRRTIVTTWKRDDDE